MGTSKIEWTEKTWNPATGCTKTSPGCRSCYAERMSHRLAGRVGYPADNPFAVTLHPDRLEEPVHWHKPSRIFVCSMGDLFHDEVPDDFISAVFGVMAACPQHTFIVLTKRADRMERWFRHVGKAEPRLDPKSEDPTGPSLECAYQLLRQEAEHHPAGMGGPFHCKHGPNPTASWPLPNVWVGVTAEDQRRADQRIPLLLDIPAAVRFVSCEPLLGGIGLSRYVWTRAEVQTAARVGISLKGGLDWVIAGGETGPGARPAHPDWFRGLRDQCKAAAVPFFFKAWGHYGPGCSYYGIDDTERESALDAPHVLLDPSGGVHDVDLFGQPSLGVWIMHPVGKARAGHLLDGVEHREEPHA